MAVALRKVATVDEVEGFQRPTFSHSQSILQPHLNLCRRYLRAIEECIKHDRTNVFCAEITTGHAPSVLSHGKVTSSFRAKCPPAQPLREALELGFRKAYFVPYPLSNSLTNQSQVPTVTPKDWVELTAVSAIGFDNDKYQFTLPEHCPPLVGVRGTILGRPNTPNEVMRDYYQHLINKPEEFPLSAAVNLFNMTEDVDLRQGIVDNHLSDEQVRSLNFYANNPATMIWGPPGTGKSQTLCALIAYAVRKGLRVLLVSGTNKAIDSVAGKIWDLAHGPQDGPMNKLFNELVTQNLVTRYGTPTEPNKIKNIAYSVRISQGDEVLSPEESFLQDRVSICTNYRLIHSDLPPFDVVFIDEAGAISPPVLYCAAAIASQKVVVSGDPAQLPPVFTYNKASRETRDIFEGHIYSHNKVRTTAGEEPDPRLCIFTVQFRMSEKLAVLPRMSSLYFAYITSPHVRSPKGEDKVALMSYPMPDEPFVVIDTSACDSPRFLDKTNPIHHQVTAQMVEFYMSQGGMGELGIISPYRNQATEMSRWVRARGYAKVITGTVHQFQGSEYPLIVYDTVESPNASGEPMRHFFTDDLRNPGTTTNLINVACSRAKAKFIMLMNVDYVRDNLTNGCYMHRILHHAEAMRTIIPAGLALKQMGRDLSLTTTGGANFPKDPFVITVRTSADFYAQLRTDIKRSRMKIQIFSKKVDRPSIYQLIKWVDAQCLAQHIVGDFYLPGNLGRETTEFIHTQLKGKVHLGLHRCADWPYDTSAFLVFDRSLAYSTEPENRPNLCDGEMPYVFQRYKCEPRK